MSAVTEYLTRAGVPFDVLRHAPVMSAMGEAFALGVPPEMVVKTLVLDAGPIHVLAVVPASRRLDMHLVRHALLNHHAHLASEDELIRDFGEYELGTLPPLGSLLSAPVVIDPEVVQHDQVVFAAGSRGESVRVHTRDLLALEHAFVTPIVRSIEAEETRRNIA